MLVDYNVGQLPAVKNTRWPVQTPPYQQIDLLIKKSTKPEA